MYYGKMTKELEDLIEQYEQLFGYNPCGAEEFEIGDNSYNDFVDVLKKCVNNKKDIFYYWGIDDDDDDF